MDPHILAMMYVDNLLDDEEFEFLMKHSKQPAEPAVRAPFSLEGMTDLECQKNFRFLPADLRELCDVLCFPESFVADNRCRMPGLEGLCLLLRRLAYPCRLHDLEEMFGRDLSVLSRLFNMALDHVFDMFGHLLTDMDQAWLSRNQLQRMADAAVAKGCPLDKCVGFVDGTNIKICRLATSRLVDQ